MNAFKKILVIGLMLWSLVIFSAYTTFGLTDVYYNGGDELQLSSSTINSNSWTNESNAFDSDFSTYAYKTGDTGDSYLGKTFINSVYIENVTIKARFDVTTFSSGYGTKNAYLQSYDGSTWSNEAVILTYSGDTDVSYNSSVALDKNVKGLRIYYEGLVSVSNQYQAYLYELQGYKPDYSTFDLYNSSNFNNTVTIANSTIEGNIYEYTFDGNITSYNPDYNDGTLNGYIFNNGTLNNFVNTTRDTNCINETFGNCLNFDGVDDYVQTGPFTNLTDNFTLSLWVKDNIEDSGELIDTNGGTNNRIFVIPDNGDLKFFCNNGTSSETLTAVNSVGIDYFYYLTVVRNGSNAKIYINGTLKAETNSFPTGTCIGSGKELNLGTFRSPGSNFFNGSMDDIRIFNRSLSSTEISDLYNRTYLNGSGLVWASSFEEITNEKIHDRNNAVCYNCTNTIHPFRNWYDGLFSTWYFEELSNETNLHSFYVDTINPQLNDSLTTEYNSYNINLTQYINYSDENSGIDYCQVTFNTSQSTNCANQSFRFSYSGNHSYNITVKDLAGNSNTNSGVIYVNPIQYVRFNSSLTGNYVSNYEVETDNGIYTVSGTYLELPLFDLGIGTHNLKFIKLGYNNETFTITFNTTSELNVTYEVDPITLTMQMFDNNNPTKQLTFNVTILNSSDSVTFNNQVNMTKEYNNIPVGVVDIIVQSDGYSTAYYFQNITSKTSITIIGYLINSSLTSTVTFNVIDKSSELGLEEVLIEAQQLINGSYTTISQAETDSSGITFMILNTNVAYKFILTKNGYVSATINAIPGTTSYTIRLEERGSSFGFIDGISYYLLPNTPVLYNEKNYSFRAFISGTGLSLINYTIVNQNGLVLYNITSTNPTGTRFEFNITNLNATNITEITQTLIYYKNGNINTISKNYRTTSIGTASFIYYIKYGFANEDTEENNIFKWLLMIISIGGSLLFGRKVGANVVGNSLLVVLVTGWFTYIEWMPDIYFGAIAVGSLIIFIAGGIIK